MRVMTFATNKKVTYMDQLIEVPLWVNYIAVQPRQRGSNADLIGCAAKPIIGTKCVKWRAPSSAYTIEVIGAVTCSNVRTPQEAFATLRKLPKA